jgi:membrane-associated phospholipid phosphatase
MGTAIRSFAQKRSYYLIQKNTALFFSVVFHPVMLPTLFFSFAALMIPDLLTPFSDTAMQWGFIGLIFITTMAIPLLMLSVHFMLHKKKVGLALLYLQNRKDRIYPFFHTAIFYTGITYLFHMNLHLNIFICAFMGMVSIALLLTACISLFYKISAHTMALSAVVGYLFLMQLFLPGADLLISSCSLILITGITASSRLFLRAHHPGQIIAGCLVGLLSTCSCLIWLYA